jgi:hypothetical protein
MTSKPKQQAPLSQGLLAPVPVAKSKDLSAFLKNEKNPDFARKLGEIIKYMNSPNFINIVISILANNDQITKQQLTDLYPNDVARIKAGKLKQAHKYTNSDNVQPVINRLNKLF